MIYWVASAGVVADQRGVNLVTGDTNGWSDAFVRDRTNLTTTRVSTSTAGVEANERTLRVVISANGGVVAFVSQATNLVPADLTSGAEVFAKTLASGVLDRVAVTTAGLAASSTSHFPAISADGRFVVFVSWGTNLVANDLNGKPDVFVRDRIARTTERVSVSTANAEGNDDSFTGGGQRRREIRHLRLGRVEPGAGRHQRVQGCLRPGSQVRDHGADERERRRRRGRLVQLGAGDQRRR